jgi:hypothetical protein
MWFKIATPDAVCESHVLYIFSIISIIIIIIIIIIFLSCVQGFGGETWGKESTWKTQA